MHRLSALKDSDRNRTEQLLNTQNDVLTATGLQSLATALQTVLEVEALSENFQAARACLN